MPIHLDSHPEDIELTPGTTKSDIVVYLYRNSAYGYRPTEISAALDIPDGTATTTLSRLYADGLVGKTADGHYHAFDDRDDVRRYVASHEQLHRLFGHHRSEADPSADAPQAVPDDAGLTPDDVEQTGGGAKAEIPPERLAQRDTTGEEPAVDDWITETGTDSNAGQDGNQN